MDIYLLTLHSEAFDEPKITFSSSRLKDEGRSISQPYIVNYLEQRRRSIYRGTLKLTARPCKPLTDACWNYHDDVSGDHVLQASNDVASDIILKLSDDLPAPGSYLLHVIWDMRGIEIGSIRDFAAIFGAIKKICSWHAGRLHAYAHQKTLDSLQQVITFMDPCAFAHKLENDTCITFHLPKEILWRGSLDILTEDVSPHQIHGFALLMDSLPEPELVVGGIPSTSDKSFSEDCLGHVWIAPSIHLISYVDITTIPLFYFSGKRFILQYHLNTNIQRDCATIQKMCDVLNGSSVGVFLCCLKYSISKHKFDPIPEFNSDNWKEAILKDPSKINAPKFTLLSEIHTLHILLRHSEVRASESSKNLKQFTAHILHRPSELDFMLPFQHDFTQIGSSEDEVSVNLDGLPDLNPHGLLHKQKKFDGRIAEALRQWTGQGPIPITQLHKLVNSTIQQLDAEQESLLLDVSCLPKSDPQQERECPSASFLLERQKKVLANLDKLNNKERRKLQSFKSTNPLRRGKTTPVSLDMHFKPEDVLLHFDVDGKLKHGAAIVTKSQKISDYPNQIKLKNFDDAIHVSYHGITFNIDEQAAEKFDRMCRRLVQRQVKFETSSIGSTEKVPSPATINVADSPLKQSQKAFGSTSGSNTRKRIQLKKVAEKLYKKRIRTQHSVKPDIPQSSMVLRSTPKKAQFETLENNTASSKGEKIPDVSNDEHKRQKRRTYVQDNKRRLQNLVTQSLIENGVPEDSKDFQLFSRRLYNVSMAFLRDLKSSKDLDRIMMSTVSSNVHSVISFKTK